MDSLGSPPGTVFKLVAAGPQADKSYMLSRFKAAKPEQGLRSLQKLPLPIRMSRLGAGNYPRSLDGVEGSQIFSSRKKLTEQRRRHGLRLVARGGHPTYQGFTDLDSKKTLFLFLLESANVMRVIPIDDTCVLKQQDGPKGRERDPDKVEDEIKANRLISDMVKPLIHQDVGEAESLFATRQRQFAKETPKQRESRGRRGGGGAGGSVGGGGGGGEEAERLDEDEPALEQDEKAEGLDFNERFSDDENEARDIGDDLAEEEEDDAPEAPEELLNPEAKAMKKQLTKAERDLDRRASDESNEEEFDEDDLFFEVVAGKELKEKDEDEKQRSAAAGLASSSGSPGVKGEDINLSGISGGSGQLSGTILGGAPSSQGPSTPGGVPGGKPGQGVAQLAPISSAMQPESLKRKGTKRPLEGADAAEPDPKRQRLGPLDPDDFELRLRDLMALRGGRIAPKELQKEFRDMLKLGDEAKRFFSQQVARLCVKKGDDVVLRDETGGRVFR